MIKTEVCIVGCGPIGLSSAILLARQGIQVLLVERRGELNTHPRSRFVDVGTMELMRYFGIEKQVEATGLGPDWTAFNRWSPALTSDDCVSIASPSFHSVPNTISPCLPVMTCQDHVENALLKVVHAEANIDCRFNTEARDIKQDDTHVSLTIADLVNGDEKQVDAAYLIGADGPHSRTRALIGSELETDPLQMYSQDVIFDGDLSKHVGDRKGSLLYSAGPSGVTIFQPLDGVRRWRVQIFKPHEEDLSEAEITERVSAAIGDTDIQLDIKSVGHWQPTPGCTTKFREGRIFLAGDAAHISLPTGGMGNNIGFAGARNLAWKLAYVLRGKADDSILDSYEAEMMPAAQKRIAHGVSITEGMRGLIFAIIAGEDVADGAHATRFYADYDNIILGHEYASGLVMAESTEPPVGDSEISDFIPCVRSGRRAPHVWLNTEKTFSVCDWFGTTHVLLAGVGVTHQPWQNAVDQFAHDYPLVYRAMPQHDAQGIYADDELVLVRPDGVIADHWRAGDFDDEAAVKRLTNSLIKQL